MSTRRNVLNVNLSIELKEAMDKRLDVNWSEIARHAFQAKLDNDAAEEAEFGPYIATNIKKKNGKLKK